VTGSGILRVTVTARQRLALGVGSEVSYFTGTHSFVPGSVLRGALAAAWIAEHGPPPDGSAAFGGLFDGPIRYGPMYVPGTVVVPVSVRLCKYPKNEFCKAQAVDAAFEAGAKCPACSGPLEPGKGQVELPGGIAIERITRTSIHPATAKAADGELYAHGALPAGTTLTGYIYGRDAWLERPRQLRLGGRRTVSGSAGYQAVPLSPAEEDMIPNEWPGLAAGHGSAQPAGSGHGSAQPAGSQIPPGSRDETRLVIRLASPAVFTDAAGCPRLEPDPLLDLDGATVERRWTRPVTWSGWHAASRLPKPDEVCAVAGSTYQLTGPPATLRELAARLPREGAGLRRAEGFGEIRIATHPWRPPAPEKQDRAAVQDGAAADAQVRQWLQDLHGLALDPLQLRWVADALRELQLAREHQSDTGGDAPDAIGDLFGRAAAGGFSGRQRDRLRALFAQPGPQQLRDLTTVLLAELAGYTPQESR
jgi:CRISPR-associated protein Csx10